MIGYVDNELSNGLSKYKTDDSVLVISTKKAYLIVQNTLDDTITVRQAIASKLLYELTSFEMYDIIEKYDPYITDLDNASTEVFPDGVTWYNIEDKRSFRRLNGKWLQSPDLIVGDDTNITAAGGSLLVSVGNSTIYIYDKSNNKWTGLSGGGTNLPPYIESVDKRYIVKDMDNVITIIGNYFNETTSVSVEDATIEILEKTPTKITFKATTSIYGKSSSLIVTNEDLRSWGIKHEFILADDVVGKGPAGDFLTTFNNAPKSGARIFDKSGWTPEVEGGLQHNKYWKTSTSTTPSGNTGPGNAQDGTKYLFTETSNPNNGDVNKFGWIWTENFAAFKSIEFDYHMFGSGITGVYVEGLMSDGTWFLIDKLEGQQQTSNADSWKHIVITGEPRYQRIRIRFGYARSYAADSAIDNILIRSE